MSEPTRCWWNYRIILWDGYYSIHEIHYTDGIVTSYSTNPIVPGGFTHDDLYYDLKNMLLAFETSVLTQEELPNGAKV